MIIGQLYFPPIFKKKKSLSIWIFEVLASCLSKNNQASSFSLYLPDHLENNLESWFSDSPTHAFGHLL